MPWICRVDERTGKDFRKLDKQIQSQILDYLEERILGDWDPRRVGKGLHSNLSGLWCYREARGTPRFPFQAGDEVVGFALLFIAFVVIPFPDAPPASWVAASLSSKRWATGGSQSSFFPL